MSLVVEDGTSKNNADSYVSVEDAWIRLPDLFTESEMAVLNTISAGDREVFLRRATYLLDSIFEDKFGGYRANERQSRMFPRYAAFYSDRVATIDGIPQEIIDAQLMMLNALKTGAITFEGNLSVSNISSTSVSIGELSESISYKTRDYQRAGPDSLPTIQFLLAPLFGRSKRANRLRRC